MGMWKVCYSDEYCHFYRLNLAVESWIARSTLSFRGERPRHASWSPDGSLLCVTMGPCVNLYDSSSNALRRVLISPNCKAPASAQFVGRSGRFLAVVSVWDIVLWDLPAQSGRFLHFFQGV